MAIVRQPYIYTMPEGFLADPSIGVKWKIYAIINGFWISGKRCYAANKFFAEKLGVSERQIRNGVAQLEEDKYLDRVIYGNSRILMPHAQVYEEAEAGVPGGGSESSAQAEAGVPHISVSNSDSKFLADETPADEITESFFEEGVERERPNRRSKEKLEIYHLFSEREQPWWRHTQQKQAAITLYDLLGVSKVQAGLEFMKEHSDDKFCPQAMTPFEYEKLLPGLKKYRNRNGL